MNDQEKLSDTADQSPAGQQGARLATALEQILSSQRVKPGTKPEIAPRHEARITRESTSWLSDPIEYVEVLLGESTRQEITVVENPVEATQYSVLEALRDKGIGDYASIPEAIAAHGGKLFSNNALDRLNISIETQAVYLALAIMSTLPPEGYGDQTVPSQKSETPQAAAYRTALVRMHELKETKLRKASAIGNQMLVDVRQARMKVADTPDAEVKAVAQASLDRALATLENYTDRWTRAAASSVFARHFMLELPAATFTPELVQAKLKTMGQTFTEQDAHLADWTILPPEPTAQEERAAPNPDGSDETPDRSRPQVIGELHQLVKDWGEGDVVKSHFRTNGADVYYAAILPQTLPDGTVIEHAVVDNPAADNARYAWRATAAVAGAEPPPHWTEVFVNKFKSEARADGARQINHVGDWQERTIDYLTSPDES